MNVTQPGVVPDHKLYDLAIICLITLPLQHRHCKKWQTQAIIPAQIRIPLILNGSNGNLINGNQNSKNIKPISAFWVRPQKCPQPSQIQTYNLTFKTKFIKNIHNEHSKISQISNDNSKRRKYWKSNPSSTTSTTTNQKNYSQTYEMRIKEDETGGLMDNIRLSIIMNMTEILVFILEQCNSSARLESPISIS